MSTEVIRLRVQNPGTEIIMLDRYLGLSPGHRRGGYLVQRDWCKQVSVFNSLSPKSELQLSPYKNKTACFIFPLDSTATVGHGLTLLQKQITFQKCRRATFTVFLSQGIHSYISSKSMLKIPAILKRKYSPAEERRL